jgi:putative endonuclease
MSTDQRHVLGSRGEALAATHLERLGYAIVARNHRTRWGELDVVAHGHDVLVFCEVKSRRHGSGSPFDAFRGPKQHQVRRMAAAYLVDVVDRPTASEVRFDAIGVVLDAHGALVSLDHLEGAF